MKLITKDNKIIELKYEPKISTKKVDFEFQQVGIELEPLYGKGIWQMFHKYSLVKIKDAHKVCVKKGITKISFLVGVIKRLT